MQLKNIKLFTKLTKKNKLWKWQEKQRKLFKELKELFTVKLIIGNKGKQPLFRAS